LTWVEFDVVEQELTSVENDFYQMVVPSSILFTDGSRGGAGTGFGVNHSGGPEPSFCLRKPSGVFISEMLAIFVSSSSW
jgi:hypothetical protein